MNTFLLLINTSYKWLLSIAKCTPPQKRNKEGLLVFGKNFSIKLYEFPILHISWFYNTRRKHHPVKFIASVDMAIELYHHDKNILHQVTIPWQNHFIHQKLCKYKFGMTLISCLCWLVILDPKIHKNMVYTTSTFSLCIGLTSFRPRKPRQRNQEDMLRQSNNKRKHRHPKEENLRWQCMV